MNFFLFALLATARTADWNYKNNGLDWPYLTNVKDNSCGKTKQSPIDLPTNMPSDRILSFKQDNFNKIYSNPRDVEVQWTGYTSSISLHPELVNFFTSWHAYDFRKTAL